MKLQTGAKDQAYKVKMDEDWTWQDVRDYVLHELEERFGPQSVNSVTTAATFQGFVKRHGVRSAEIARYAMETCRGRWYGEQVTVNRFCKASDPHFSDPIIELIDR